MAKRDSLRFTTLSFSVPAFTRYFQVLRYFVCFQGYVLPFDAKSIRFAILLRPRFPFRELGFLKRPAMLFVDCSHLLINPAVSMDRCNGSLKEVLSDQLIR